MIKSKFRIIYQDNTYIIQEGKYLPFLKFIEVWRTKSYISTKHPDLEFGFLGKRISEFKTMKEAKKYLRKFQKGEL